VLRTFIVFFDGDRCRFAVQGVDAWRDYVLRLNKSVGCLCNVLVHVRVAHNSAVAVYVGLVVVGVMSGCMASIAVINGILMLVSVVSIVSTIVSAMSTIESVVSTIVSVVSTIVCIVSTILCVVSAIECVVSTIACSCDMASNSASIAIVGLRLAVSLVPGVMSLGLSIPLAVALLIKTVGIEVKAVNLTLRSIFLVKGMLNSFLFSHSWC